MEEHMTRSQLIILFTFVCVLPVVPALAMTEEQGSTVPTSRANVTDPDEQVPAFMLGVSGGGNSPSATSPNGFVPDQVSGPSIVRPGFAQEDRIRLPTPYNTPSH